MSEIATSMAQNLSDDILYAIFLQALPSEFYLSMIGWPHIPWQVAPYNFSLVCRSWRTLVLSRPTLWSRISVKSRAESGTDDPDPRNPYIYRILERWLSFSAPTPLWIHIDISAELEGVHGNLLSIFTPEYLRWSSFNMNVGSWRDPTSSELPIFMLRGLAPITSLSLKFVGSESTTVCVDLSSFICDHTSQLEHLSVAEGAIVRLPTDSKTPRLTRLRSLHYENMDEGKSLEDLRCLLSASSNLDSLAIRTFGKTVSTSTSIRGSLHLPHLTSLSLTTSNQFATNYILNLLTCPSIHDLQFRTIPYHSREDAKDHPILEPQQIHDFLARSSRGSNLSMKSLSLDWVVVDEAIRSNPAPALKDLLAALRNLKILQLDDSVLNHATLVMLTVPFGGQFESPLCPSISRLSISHTPGTISDFTGETVEEMIVTRWKAGFLRAVNIRLPSNFGKIKYRDRIQECMREGLVVIDTFMDWEALCSKEDL